MYSTVYWFVLSRSYKRLIMSSLGNFKNFCTWQSPLPVMGMCSSAFPVLVNCGKRQFS